MGKRDTARYSTVVGGAHDCRRFQRRVFVVDPTKRSRSNCVVWGLRLMVEAEMGRMRCGCNLEGNGIWLVFRKMGK